MLMPQNRHSCALGVRLGDVSADNRRIRATGSSMNCPGKAPLGIVVVRVAYTASPPTLTF